MTIDYDEYYGILQEKPFSELFVLACDYGATRDGKMYHDVLNELDDFVIAYVTERDTDVSYFCNSYGHLKGTNDFEKLKESLILYLMYNFDEMIDNHEGEL